MAKKIVVVTSLIGAYDSNLLEFEYDKSKYEFVCYTNMKRLTSDTWTIKYVDELEVPNDNAKSSYYYKWNPHKYLPKSKYDTMIWVDSSFTEINMDEIDLMVEEFKEADKSIYIEKHPGRNSLQAELEANVRLEKDDESKMKKQVQSYFDFGYREEYTRMVETGLSIRKFKDEDLIALSDVIWGEISPEENTKRDQLVWDYAVWLREFYDYAFFTFGRKLKAITFTDHPHRKDHKEKVLLVGPWFGEDKYEDAWVQSVNNYLGKTPVDKVIVGCRPGRESLYESIAPDIIIPNDPEGVRAGNLLDGRVPKFNTKSDTSDIIHFTSDHPEVNTYDRNTHVLWATIRPDIFDEKYTVWLDKAEYPDKIIPYIVVDTEEDKAKIHSVAPETIIVSKPPRKGVCYPSYIASSAVTSDNPRDIVIYGSDDFVPMDKWDVVMYDEFMFYDGSLLVDDTTKPVIKDIMTIPIMTCETLEKLNKVIYHPVYAHCYSDNELLLNLEEMDRIRDIRVSKPNVYFEHQHFVNGGRKADEHDKANMITTHTGKNMWELRKKMSLEERLEVNIDEPTLSILILTLVERKEHLDRLLAILEPQIVDGVEIVIESDNRENTIGKKRNNALAKAKGRYIAFVDDDDMVADNYVHTIMNILISTDVDCCSLTGEITIDGGPTERFIHSLRYDDWTDSPVDGGLREYYRPPNHLNVVRREIATYVGFDDESSFGEDHDYSMRLRPYISVESHIEDVMYYYDYVSTK